MSTKSEESSEKTGGGRGMLKSVPGWSSSVKLSTAELMRKFTQTMISFWDCSEEGQRRLIAVMPTWSLGFNMLVPKKEKTEIGGSEEEKKTRMKEVEYRLLFINELQSVTNGVAGVQYRVAV
jgi:hypothetical protein